MKDKSAFLTSRADFVYLSIREDIFTMRLLPGDKMTEANVAASLGVSRTPAREALQRLQNDGLMRGYVRGGWEVVPIDIKRFDDLYETRQLIEKFAIAKLFDLYGCEQQNEGQLDDWLDRMDRIWQVAPDQRVRSGNEVIALDESFHQALVWMGGNAELSSVMQRLTDRIRVVRRLDLVHGDCIDETYDEHAAILQAIRSRQKDLCLSLIGRHIEGSRQSVQAITAERLEYVRQLKNAQ